jgi:acyl dehydratase
MLAPYSVVAFNTAKASENRIHDDSIARRFGFTGGLVPGVDVYAYMTHPPVARWGRDWLERGTAECRFDRPVYDGETATVTATAEGEALALVVDSHGERCATGRAALEPAPPLPSLAEFPAVEPPAARPPANETTLAVGTCLGNHPIAVTAAFAAQYLEDTRERHPLYAAEGLVHPGLVLRLANRALGDSVVLGPWIHVGSTVRHYAAARVGMTLTIRARVVANYDRKGHRFVELDALAVADGAIPLARIHHVAIYRPRQVAEAAQAAATPRSPA